MNKTELKKFYKSELRDIETQESVLKQSLSSIANRKRTIVSALEKLGASMQAHPGKKQVLTDKQILEIKASIIR